MHPTLLRREEIDAFLSAGHWTRDTMADRYRNYAERHPDKVACQDCGATITWAELETATNTIAANLVARGIARDETALIQMPTSFQEVILRIALKKAGIIGAFAPLQWRRKELQHVIDRIAPSIVFISRRALDAQSSALFDVSTSGEHSIAHRIDLDSRAPDDWVNWSDLAEPTKIPDVAPSIPGRAFRYDEVSLITVSSGTSGIAKLCEWPEAAQLCMGRAIAERMGLEANDNIGIFAPMSGAAGLLVWTVSGTVPCQFTFPSTFEPTSLLELAKRNAVSVITTVPVILARLAQEPLEQHALPHLRLLRVGTAAADLDAAKSFEARTQCKVIVASGAMECPGFGHAGATEPKALRLNGSVGLPLRGCCLRIDNEAGKNLPAGEIGELKVSAPFASSGYWHDPDATAAVWSEGWYATGDIGELDENGRLTLRGRLKETINRSGLKILPVEVETEISKHPDVFACAVVGAPDPEYGAVPWAFVQMKSGCDLDADSLKRGLEESGLAYYKVPQRFIAMSELPRVNDNKIDKKSLLATVANATR